MSKIKNTTIPVSSPDQSDLAVKLREFLSYKSGTLLECDTLKRRLRGVADDILYGLRAVNGKGFADLEEALAAPKAVKYDGFVEANTLRQEIIAGYEAKKKALSERAIAIAELVTEASRTRQKEIDAALETTFTGVMTAIRPYCLDEEECERLAGAFGLVQDLQTRRLSALGGVNDAESVATAAARLLNDLGKPLPK
jgi:hypothetical protein